MSVFAEIYHRISLLFSDPYFLKYFFDNRFYLIMLVILLMRFKYATYSSMWLSALVNIPGTFLHELMHYVVGAFLNAQPVNFTVFPRKNTMGDYVMGSVSFKNITYYNAIPASMAPLLLLPIGFYLNRYFLPTMQPTFFNYIIYILFQTIIIENAIPSRKDFKIAFSYLSGIIIYGILLISLLLMI